MELSCKKRMVFWSIPGEMAVVSFWVHLVRLDGITKSLLAFSVWEKKTPCVVSEIAQQGDFPLLTWLLDYGVLKPCQPLMWYWVIQSWQFGQFSPGWGAYWLTVWKGNLLPVFAEYYQSNMMYSGQGFSCSFICSLHEICELTHKHELC